MCNAVVATGELCCLFKHHNGALTDTVQSLIVIEANEPMKEAVSLMCCVDSHIERELLLPRAGPSGVSLVVAVGPFTLSEDLDYAPLAALLAVCRQRRPDVLMLLGPFVDAEHPLLAKGTVDLTFEDIFESQVDLQAVSSTCRLLLFDHHSVTPSADCQGLLQFAAELCVILLLLITALSH